MDSEKLMSQEELDLLVSHGWARSQAEILKQVEYAITNEMSSRARSRAHTLIIREIDSVLRPKIAEMKAAMEEKAVSTMARVLPQLEEAMHRSLADAVREVNEYTIRQMLAGAEGRLRTAMVNALEKAFEKVPPA